MKKNNFNNKYFLNYDQVKQYLIESKNYIYLSIFIFLFFAFFGFFVPLPEEIINQLLQYFNELISKTRGYNFYEMFVFLFQNNLFASFFGMIGGMLFGIFSLFNGIINGIVLGFVANISVTNSGFISLWKLLPHGIFELPALFVSLGLGMKLGGKFLEKYFVIKSEIKQIAVVFILGIILLVLVAIFSSYSFFSGSFLVLMFIVLISYYFFKEEELRKEFIYALNTFFLIVIPLLVFAAIIESFLITF